MIGMAVGNYRVVRQLGEGGMGAVYVAEHSMLGRPAAIKVLLPELSQHRDMVMRFFNEAKAATAIRHPGIVEIYDFGYLAGDRAYLIMEYLEGESLATRLRREHRLRVPVALALTRQIAAALQAAHAKGIVHRDLKPDNAFVVPDPEIGERIKLLDFGIAKLVNERVTGERTRTGAVMGTPTYMSPEQCRGAGSVDHRSDLYSLGCMLYEMLIGRPPFVAEGAGDIIAHHLYFQPTPLRAIDPAIPEPIERLVGALLQKDPSARPGSASELVAALDNVAAPRSGPILDATRSPAMVPTQVVAVAATTQTTLSGAAGATSATSAAAAPRRRGILIGGTAAAAIAIAAIAIVAAKSGKHDTTTAAATNATASGSGTASAIGAPPITPPPAAAPAAPATSAASPSPALQQAPPVVTIHVTSDPPGATVLSGDATLGTTPGPIQLPKTDGKVTLVLRKAGFEDSTVQVDTSGDGKVDQSLVAVAPPSQPTTTASTTKPVPHHPQATKPATKAKTPKAKAPSADDLDPYAN